MLFRSNEVIKAGTLVIVGTYRGDPVYNTLRVWGRFTETKVGLAEDGTEPVISKDIDRPRDGEALMFAAIPTDGQVSDISDGLFIFIPNIQKEAELQEVAHCDGINLLPSQIKVELYRTDNPNNADSKRKTAETLWVHSPGGTDLPTITLTTEEAGK